MNDRHTTSPDLGKDKRAAEAERSLTRINELTQRRDEAQRALDAESSHFSSLVRTTDQITCPSCNKPTKRLLPDGSWQAVCSFCIAPAREDWPDTISDESLTQR